MESHVEQFADKLGLVSDVQGERLNQNTKTVEEAFQGPLDVDNDCRLLLQGSPWRLNLSLHKYGILDNTELSQRINVYSGI